MKLKKKAQIIDIIKNVHTRVTKSTPPMQLSFLADIGGSGKSCLLQLFASARAKHIHLKNHLFAVPAENDRSSLIKCKRTGTFANLRSAYSASETNFHSKKCRLTSLEIHSQRNHIGTGKTVLQPRLYQQLQYSLQPSQEPLCCSHRHTERCSCFHCKR